jgi:hypothetical protein
MNASRKGIIIAALPGLTWLLVLYSLAIHMRLSLGGWPYPGTEEGFSRALAVHSDIAVGLFIALFLSLFALPIPILVCLFVERLRRLALYLAFCALVTLLCLIVAEATVPGEFKAWLGA